MNQIKPLKRFGQNYLQDQNILKKIVDEIDPKVNDLIIEIGPGTGSLTGKLLDRNPNLIAVEIDKRVSDYLLQRFDSLKLIQKDFLDLDLNEYLSKPRQKLRIVGNIPYNITSPILFKIFENNTIIQDAVFMVQLELAQRMTSKIGSKEYGILSVLVNFFGNPKLVFKVSPNVFYPKPKVHSAIVHISLNNDKTDKQFNSLFKSIVKACFGKRRKTLKNSLSNSIFASIDFSKCGVDLSLRAEQLTQNDFIRITEFAGNNFSYNNLINE
jgi:16S rRNA (adenine1518-N6/adenine1519-N6)-dimethyltransferase